MRIAQVSPLTESVPPQGYGGTERIVSYLTEDLVARGHEVTLFASGDSITSARLIPCCERFLRLDPTCLDPLARHYLMLERVFKMAREFDMIHFHIGFLHFPLARRSQVRHLTTQHGRLDAPEARLLFDEYRELPLISISNAQRGRLRANWTGTVYHGIPLDLLTPRAPDREEYLVFVGRVSPEKGIERAIEIAERAGLPLKIAAKIDRADREYFEQRVKPLLAKPFIDYHPEISDAEKNRLIGGARAALFPIDWPEPFGLVMIESMACGTPVVAYRRGSVPEVITEGVTGFVVDSVDEALAAVARIGEIDRAGCRAEFEARFDSRRMVDDYLEHYERIASGRGVTESEAPIAARVGRDAHEPVPHSQAV